MQTQKNNIAFAYSLPERLGLCVDRVGGKRALSNMVGISESQLFRYLNGVNEMTSDKLLAVARAAKVDPGWLLSGDGDMLNGGHTTDKRPAFRGELLVQITQLFEELLVEFEKPFNPRQRARAITFLYNALRHEETMRGIEYQPNKFDMLKSLNYLAELRTEEELEILTSAMRVLEYDDITLTHGNNELLRTWCNLVIRGTRGYYSSYPGQVYFERTSGGKLDSDVILDIQNLVQQAIKNSGNTEIEWLDLGCGSGRHLVHIASHIPNVKIHGLELSQLGFDTCKKLMDSEKLPKNSVSIGDARQLPYSANQFDVIYANLSLYCLPYIPDSGLGLEEAFSEIVRVLKPKGIIKMLYPKGHWRDYSMSYQFMNENSFQKLADTFGLKVVSMSDEHYNPEVKHKESKSLSAPCPLRLKHHDLIHVILQK